MSFSARLSAFCFRGRNTFLTQSLWGESSFPFLNLLTNRGRNPLQFACLPLSRYSFALRMSSSSDSMRSRTAFLFGSLVLVGMACEVNDRKLRCSERERAWLAY